MLINNHRLEKAKQISLTNFNQRPNQTISLIIIHSISLPPRKFDNHYVEDFFNNQLETH